MAAAQEFASPGEHMKSIESGSGGVGNLVAGTIGSQGPPVYYGNINNSFREFEDEQGYFNSARSFSNSVRNFSKEYMDYNDKLFNTAMDYDKYMSNTAIQRQVADLKAAGLNPILGAYLGGATYKGVSAPYISISPASALQAYTQNEASHYASDTSRMTSLQVAKIQTSSSEFIAQYNKTMERLISGDRINADKDIVELKKDADAFLIDLKHLNDKDLANLGFKNQKDLYEYQNSIDNAFWNYRNGITGDNYWLSQLVDRLGRVIPFATGILHN